VWGTSGQYDYGGSAYSAGTAVSGSAQKALEDNFALARTIYSNLEFTEIQALAGLNGKAYKKHFMGAVTSGGACMPTNLSQFTNLGGLGGSSGAPGIPLNDPMACGPWLCSVPTPVSGNEQTTPSWLVPSAAATAGSPANGYCDILLIHLAGSSYWGSTADWVGSAGAWVYTDSGVVPVGRPAWELSCQARVEAQPYQSVKQLFPCRLRKGDADAVANISEEALKLVAKIPMSCAGRKAAGQYFGVKGSDGAQGVGAFGVGSMGNEMEQLKSHLQSCTEEKAAMQLSNQRFLSADQIGVLRELVSHLKPKLEIVVPPPEVAVLHWGPPDDDDSKSSISQWDMAKGVRPNYVGNSPVRSVAAVPPRRA